MGRVKLRESEIIYDGKEHEIEFVKSAISKLPLKEMGLEIYNDIRRYSCKIGTMQSIVVYPEDKELYSIWIPEGAKRIHSTEDYQAFSLDGVDYFIYRRPKHHVKKVVVLS